MSARNQGFTLIELIVSVSIIALMTGGGISVYSMFRSKKAAISDAHIVANTLRDAHRRSMAGLKPTSCGDNGLQGYTVSISGSSMQLVATCPGGSPDTETVDLSSGTITATPATYFFPSITGGATTGTLDVCSNGIKYRVSVTSAGSISDPAEIGSC